MTITEEAKAFLEQFLPYVSSEKAGDESFIFDRETQIHNAKKCAEICIDRMIEEYTKLPHFAELYDENIYHLDLLNTEIKILEL